MSITVSETSFDLLLQSITAPARSRSNTNQSLPPPSENGAQQSFASTHAKQEIHQTEYRRGSNGTSIATSSATASSNTASWRSRSRSGSVASSASSGKLAFTGMLRHALPRTGNIGTNSVQEHAEATATAGVGDRPFPMARRVTGAQKSAGCVLSADAQVTANVQGLTPDGLPVWWCHFDNMVVFDGMLKDGDTGDWIPLTRSSKGLPVSNKHGEEESVLLDLQCEHCKTVLGLQKWRYSAKVCKRSVCAGCKVRCRQEYFRMMKQGHCFNHFEKVAQNDGSATPVLARIPSAEITSSVLGTATASASSKPAKDLPKIDRPATSVAHLTSSASENLAPVDEQKPAVKIQTILPQELLSQPSTKPRSAPSISGLYFKDTEQKSAEAASSAPNETGLGVAVELSPTPSAEDIGIAISVDEPRTTPDRRSVEIQGGTGASEAYQEAKASERQDDVPVQTPEPAVEAAMPLAARRGTATSLSITLPEDCQQDFASDLQHEQQADSPQSEHPETPTFDMCEPGPIIEDIMSPKFAEGAEEEPFDISLMIRNLDTDEVTALPAAH